MSTRSEKPHNALVIAAGVAAIAVTMVAIHALNSDRESVVLGGIRNAGHLPLCVLLAAGLFSLFARWSHPFLTTAAISLFIALIAEMSQHLTGGDVDWRDLARDGAGIALALCAIAAWRRFTRRPAIRLSLTLIPLAIACIPLAYWLAVYASRALLFPCLFDASRPLLQPIYRPLSSTLASNDDGGITISLGSAAYAGVRIVDPASDWRGYDQLVFSARTVVPAKATLTLRIHDDAHDHAFDDRFNRTFTLGAKAKTFMIALHEVETAPANRRMDLGRIAEVTLFRTDPDSGERLIIGPVCLR